MNVNTTPSQSNRTPLIAEVCKALLAAAFLTACTSVPSEVSLNKLHERERIYVGRFKVNLNGKGQPRCELYVNYDLGPVLLLKPDSTGMVVYRTDRDHPRFTRITCLHEKSRFYSAWHQLDLPVEKLGRTDSNLKVTYFGDVSIDWMIDEADTDKAAMAAAPEPDSRRIGHVKDSGSMKVSVVSNLPAAQTEWDQLHPDSKERGVTIVEDLIKKEN